MEAVILFLIILVGALLFNVVFDTMLAFPMIIVAICVVIIIVMGIVAYKIK
jgi:hypothetical protein